MPTNTSRLALPYPATTDNVSAFPAVSASEMGILDNATLITSGTLAARPASTQTGNEYYATDTAQLFKYTGSAWQQILTGFAARASFATNRTITASNVFTVLTATTTTFDPAGAFSAGAYVCPVAGFYHVSVQYVCITTGACTMYATIMKNGASVSLGSANGTTSAQTSYQVAVDTISASAGDQLAIGAATSSASAQTANAGYISIIPVN